MSRQVTIRVTEPITALKAWFQANNGWTHQKLADKLDLSRNAISKTACGIPVLGYERALQLAELVGVDVKQILEPEKRTMWRVNQR